MLFYLWNLCKFVLLKIIALSWNVVIKIVRGEQPQQLNNTPKRKVSMAVEVWTDVLSFVKRDELARGVSLTNWRILHICWPRLHGNKVMAHERKHMIIRRQYEYGWWSPKIYMSPNNLLGPEDVVPIANCPPPDYITGFRDIQIHFLNAQVLAFIKVIAPRLTGYRINLGWNSLMKMENLDEQQRVFINKLLKFQKDIISISTNLDNIPFLSDMDNKTRYFQLGIKAATDIPLLMKMLATPRLDGQQRVILLYFKKNRLSMKMLDAIKQNFRDSIKPLPQPFYISCEYLDPPHNLNISRSEEENAQTDETLTILPANGRWRIYRHPKEEHGKWAEDARNIVAEGEGNKIFQIYIDHLGLWTRN